MRVATAQFQLGNFADPAVIWASVENQVARAAKLQAAAILLPEYFTLALAPFLAQNGTSRPFTSMLQNLARQHQDIGARIRQLAQQHNIWVIGGTVPATDDGKDLCNRCYIASPTGKLLHQDKLNMTQWELRDWGISGRDTLVIFSIDGLRCAVVICYDIEFPQLSLALAARGVQLVFVPSCTESLHGYWRVRHCAHARAIENQFFTILSSLVGGVDGIEDMESHYGQGAILTPCDIGFPSRGILAEGIVNKSDVVLGDLPLEALPKVRAGETVLNLADNLAFQNRAIHILEC